MPFLAEQSSAKAISHLRVGIWLSSKIVPDRDRELLVAVVALKAARAVSFALELKGSSAIGRCGTTASWEIGAPGGTLDAGRLVTTSERRA